MRTLLTQIVRTLLPQQCHLCGLEAEKVLCMTCADDLERIEPACVSCGLPVPAPAGVCGACQNDRPAWRSAQIPFAWRGDARTLVLRMKRQCLPGLARQIVQIAHLRPEDYAGFVVCPVPSTPWRITRRGFNPAAIIAHAVADQCRLPIQNNLLRRRAGPRQTGLKRMERLANVEGRFFAQGDVQGLRVLLVDDVVTTGATADQATTALLSAGAHEVRLFALARSIESA